jgi:hypothetical protein
MAEIYSARHAAAETPCLLQLPIPELIGWQFADVEEISVAA